MAEKQRVSRGGRGHCRDQHRAVQGAVHGHEAQEQEQVVVTSEQYFCSITGNM